MTSVSHLNALYSAAPIVLWVEDAVTRDYLKKGWGDPSEIEFLVAGGNEAIPPTVQAAVREGITHVYGVVDRDFSNSNISGWSNPDLRVFRLPRHEIENYCLDSVAIQGCGLNNRKRDQTQVNAELLRLANLQPSWLACRRVLWRMRADIQQDFPSHPNIVDVSTTLQAEQHSVNSSWYTQLTTRSSQWAQPTTVRNELLAAEADHLAAIGSGAWLGEFSGKEIFRQIRSFVYQPPQNPGSRDSDFAKSIGDWQFSNNQLPPDLNQLRSALRVRVGLPP